ncbi:MAG TPA: Gfo/Idh/MocA family oxidoreductase [Blastocatellia bacterium]
MANEKNSRKQSRRDFIRAGAVAAGTTLAARITSGAHITGNDTIRIGLVGCGDRGTGAVINAISAAPGVKLVAMGDVFKDRLDASRKILNEKHPGEMEVTAERCFVGFDAFEKVLASDADYIILATPPAFRPQHIKAAVKAGKNIFTEKPVAVDAAGVRAVLAAYEESKTKSLAIAAGTQRRHQKGYLETMRRIRDGSIGDIVAARCYWNQGGLWKKDRQKEWSDLEWQMRNWLYFTWLSGDHIVEQHVHNIDVINWAMDAHPVRATGMGGRQSRTDPAYGHIYDHFSIDYEYENGVHLMSMCRQVQGTTGNVSEALVGTKGNSQVNRYIITGQNAWRMAEDERKAERNPYEQEHADLIASIRAGKPINELKNVAESTLTAIMGRMSAYTGKLVTWEQALNSKENLVPADLAFGPMKVPPVAVPGVTELI